MPICKQDYAPDWAAMSLSVRTEAQCKCEWCGVENRRVIRRFQRNDWEYVDTVRVDDAAPIEATDKMTWARLRFHGLTRIVLTVAHLDRDSHNNNRDNLAALCQRCHLRHDIRQHLANRAYGRHHKREHQLKLEL